MNASFFFPFTKGSVYDRPNGYFEYDFNNEPLTYILDRMFLMSFLYTFVVALYEFGIINKFKAW